MRVFYKYFCVLPTVIGLCWSCHSIQDTYEEFLVDGESIYIGVPDTIIVDPGYERLRFNVIINADPKIEKGIIVDLLNEPVHEFSVERRHNGNDTISFILDFEEGNHTLFMILMDGFGNKSLKKEIVVEVYGSLYENGLVNRQIVNIEMESSSFIINWDQATDELEKTVLEYENSYGNLDSVVIYPQDEQTILSEYKIEGEYSIQSFYKPMPNAIDRFASDKIFYRFLSE